MSGQASSIVALQLDRIKDVYFDRSTAGFSEDAVPRAKSAQLKLENYYKVAVDSAIERNARFKTLLSCISSATSRLHDFFQEGGT